VQIVTVFKILLDRILMSHHAVLVYNFKTHTKKFKFSIFIIKSSIMTAYSIDFALTLPADSYLLRTSLVSRVKSVPRLPPVHAATLLKLTPGPRACC
jgi:hypothetical protein